MASAYADIFKSVPRKRDTEIIHYPLSIVNWSLSTVLTKISIKYIIQPIRGNVKLSPKKAWREAIFRPRHTVLFSERRALNHLLVNADRTAGMRHFVDEILIPERSAVEYSLNKVDIKTA